MLFELYVSLEFYYIMFKSSCT